MKYNPKPYNARLTRYLARQAAKIQKIINASISQSVLSAERTGVRANADGDFFFRDYPTLSKQIDGILHDMAAKVTETIQAGVEWAWDLSNTKNDDMVWRIVKSIGSTRVPYGAVAKWTQKNLPALEAFQNRKVSGMGLSDRVWAYSRGIKGDLELALDLGLGEGKSADALSRAVRSYLREPDRLYRRVRDEKGVLRLSKSASNYHPGQGVYRSSYKNAKRLALNETNMAYRLSDHERWGEQDFVLGIEVHLSNNHTCLDSKGVPRPFYDICDELEGKYPKWFVFRGWHVNCRCYATAILASQEDMIDYLAAMDENGVSSYKFQGYVQDVPKQMKDWLAENEDRILRSKHLPYFLTDNPRISDSPAIAERIGEEVAERYETAKQRGEIADIFISARRRGGLTQEEIERLSDLSPKTITEGLFENGKGGYTEARAALHEQIIGEYAKNGSVPADTVYMLGGAPANGKSTVVESGMINYPKGILTLDVDRVKRMIPEYGLSEKSAIEAVRNNAANFVHEESSYLGKRIQARTLTSGDSIVIDSVNDGSYEKVDKKVAKIREQSGGKRVRADYVTCDTAESIRRNEERFKRTGRLVRMDVVKHDNAAISELFPKLIENNTFDELYLWDTNSKEKGARLVLRMVDGKLEILDAGLYQRFLAKAAGV